jgi:MarR family transcriptional regulator, organic hydroperoxide resistance regulator
MPAARRADSPDVIDDAPAESASGEYAAIRIGVEEQQVIPLPPPSGTAFSSGTAEDEIAAQAARLEATLPAILRQLFWGNPSHPLSELPLGQFRLCILLYREGRRTMSQVGDSLGISVSAVTQMADRLERAGLVERVAEPGGDRRTRYLQLTRNGFATMEERNTLRVERASAALRSLTPEQRQSILDAMETLQNAARALGPPPGMPGETTTPRP